MKTLGPDVYETTGAEMAQLLTANGLVPCMRLESVVALPMPNAAMDDLIAKALADYAPSMEMALADAVHHGMGIMQNGQHVPFADFTEHADRPLHDPEDDCA
jgi:hypothetical protein